MERLGSSDDLFVDSPCKIQSTSAPGFVGHRRGGSKDKGKVRGGAAIEMVTIISSTMDCEPEALATDSPALLVKLSVQRSIKFSRERNGVPVAKHGDWFARGWQGEFEVTDESGALMATVRYSSVNVDKQPCVVQVVAPEGAVLAQCEIRPSEESTTVIVGECPYAKCATTPGVKPPRRGPPRAILGAR